jgi:hypothetical protein
VVFVRYHGLSDSRGDCHVDLQQRERGEIREDYSAEDFDQLPPNSFFYRRYTRHDSSSLHISQCINTLALYLYIIT